MSTFYCPSCQKLASNLGSGVRLFWEKPNRLCSGCKPNYPTPARNKKAKTPTRNEDFTVNKYGLPIGTKDYIGYDKRSSLSPQEQEDLWKTGHYMTQWRSLTR